MRVGIPCKTSDGFSRAAEGTRTDEVNPINQQYFPKK
jgi:hypothetical protein